MVMLGVLNKKGRKKQNPKKSSFLNVLWQT